MNAMGSIFRLKVYDQISFRMVTSSDIAELEITEQLVVDKKSFLINPQQREELAKYLIQNSFFDEKQRSLKFMVSEVEEGDPD
mmetsp:Transcript_8201/g.13741  ORF Transcript_8201/g.13741 Transcript_8201/m.13741 type:complete len:83 (-) Transcript_8201:30-278(-)